VEALSFYVSASYKLLNQSTKIAEEPQIRVKPTFMRADGETASFFVTLVASFLGRNGAEKLSSIRSSLALIENKQLLMWHISM